MVIDLYFTDDGSHLIKNMVCNCDEVEGEILQTVYDLGFFRGFRIYVLEEGHIWSLGRDYCGINRVYPSCVFNSVCRMGEVGVTTSRKKCTKPKVN